MDLREDREEGLSRATVPQITFHFYKNGFYSFNFQKPKYKNKNNFVLFFWLYEIICSITLLTLYSFQFICNIIVLSEYMCQYSFSSYTSNILFICFDYICQHHVHFLITHASILFFIIWANIVFVLVCPIIYLCSDYRPNVLFLFWFLIIWGGNIFF